MMKSCVLLCLLAALSVACGGKVAFDGASGSSAGGPGGTSPGPGPVVACPAALATDDQVKILIGKSCLPDAECNSNNGCGGCFAKCVDGVWAAEYPEQGGVCWYLENC